MIRPPNRRANAKPYRGGNRDLRGRKLDRELGELVERWMHPPRRDQETDHDDHDTDDTQQGR